MKFSNDKQFFLMFSLVLINKREKRYTEKIIVDKIKTIVVKKDINSTKKI